MSDAVAIVLGAAVSGLVGILVVVLQQRLEHKRESATAHAARLAEFSAAAWGVWDDLGPLALAADKEAVRTALGTREAWDRFNASFAQMQLLEARTLYDSATAVQHEFVRCKRLARDQIWESDDWRPIRDPLYAAMVEFERLARKALGSEALVAG